MDARKQMLLNNWRFHLGECEEAWYKGFDDSNWENVTIPHDWSITKPLEQKNSSGTGYVCGGIGWYRLHFPISEEYRGKSVRIVFDGVYKNSQVWCNSYYLGKRPFGYASFSYDITDFVRFGEKENEISVKVTHNDLADSRWFTGSGIYRKVYLVIEEKVHPVEYGVQFTTLDVTEENGKPCGHVCVNEEIINTALTKKEVTITAKLTDAEGVEVLSLEEKVSLESAESKKIEMTGIVKDANLWSDTNSYLYTLTTYLTYDVEEGKCCTIKADTQKVGIRKVVFDPDKGLFVNGENVKLKGVCVHHDGGCLGAAMVDVVWQRRLSTLKEAGCNAIRCSHNPHMPELYDLCDRMGFFMMDEAFDEWENPKNKWSTGHNVYPPKHQGYYEDFHEWHDKDLRMMIRRDFNHPSIIMWSIGNEIDYPNDPYCHPMFETMTGNNDANKPAAERMYQEDRPNSERLTTIAKKLVRIIKEEDQTRCVTLASAFPELSTHLGLYDPLDVVGYNYKEHLYEEDHKRFPDKPFLGSENSHSFAAWLAVRDKEYISGQFLWTGIDYLGEARGWPIHGSMAGILTTAGLPKPEFYRRQAFWCEESTLAIGTRKEDEKTERWMPTASIWNYESGDTVLVKVFAKQKENQIVKLLVNGKEIGSLSEYNGDGAYEFITSYEEGYVEAKIVNTDGVEVDSVKLMSEKPPVSVGITVWNEDSLVSGLPFAEESQRENYLYQVIVSLENEDKTLCRAWDQELTAMVIGAGELVGMDNGDLTDTTSYALNSRKTYRGQLVLYIRRVKEGSITLMLKGVGDAASTFEI